MNTIRLIRLTEHAQKPTYATDGSSCFDLYASEEVSIRPGETTYVPIGIVFEIPDTYEMVIRPRNTIVYKTGLQIPNAPATIDSDFRGEVKVMVWNPTAEAKIIRPGDRIAQAILQRSMRTQFVFVEHLTETERGDKEA